MKSLFTKKSLINNPSNPIVHCRVHCAMHRKESLYALALVHGFCVTRKGGTGGGMWGHLQGPVHMRAGRLCYEGAMVGTRVGQFSPQLA